MIEVNDIRYELFNKEIVTITIIEHLDFFEDERVFEYTRSDSKYSHRCCEMILEALTFESKTEAIDYAIKQKQLQQQSLAIQIDELINLREDILNGMS